MEIDRVIQLEILKYLASFYPDYASDDVWGNLLDIANGNEQALGANLYYLCEQDCIPMDCISNVIGSRTPRFIHGSIRITHKGQDVLQGDGGISAIKNTVTVRFHADSLDFLERCIGNSTHSQQDKHSLIAKLRALPASAIEHLMKKLLDEAFGKLPNAYLLIEKLVG